MPCQAIKVPKSVRSRTPARRENRFRDGVHDASKVRQSRAVCGLGGSRKVRLRCKTTPDSAAVAGADPRAD
jgi:hypothetical protein